MYRANTSAPRSGLLNPLHDLSGACAGLLELDRPKLDRLMLGHPEVNKPRMVSPKSPPAESSLNKD